MADKSVTIKGATDRQLDELIIRLRKESELQTLIQDLRRKSAKRNPVTGYIEDQEYNDTGVSTEEPIENLYHDDSIGRTLAHFGIRGMKWGVRRFQNPDGSLTEAGRARYRKKGYSDDYITARSLKGQGYKKLNDSDLRRVVSRLDMEKRFRELSVNEYAKGLEVAKTILSAGTTIAGIYGLSQTPLGKTIQKRLTKS